MEKEQEYYGIYFNDKIPKLDKVNKFRKEVEIKFVGKAFLIKRDDDDKIIKRINLDNEYKFKKEGDYEIEFINEENKTFHLKLEIKMSFLFILFLLFGIGFLIGLLLTRPKAMEDSIFYRFYNFIDLKVLQLNIDNEQEIPKVYKFNVKFKNISKEDIKLTDSISAEAIAKNKIAPGVKGSFAILISTKKSNVDMKYRVTFEDITKEKPTNLRFKIRGQEQLYSSLQELSKALKGIIKSNSQKEIIIDWEWLYESGENDSSIKENDVIDTNEGKSLENYKFKIIVTGEEVI